MREQSCRRPRHALAAAALAIPAWLPAARAEVTEFDVLSTTRPALEGRSFGPYGAAERIIARASIAGTHLS